MTRINLTHDFQSYWHCGNGRGVGDIYDAVIQTDTSGLPYIPGRTFRGVLRECVERYLSLSGKDMKTDDIFGNETKSGLLSVSDFTLHPDVKQSILVENLQSLMRTAISSTAINDYSKPEKQSGKTDNRGSALKGSLRTVQVAIPLSLRGYLSHIQNKEIEADIKDILESSLPFFYIGIGSYRRRGFGRVSVKITGARQ